MCSRLVVLLCSVFLATAVARGIKKKRSANCPSEYSSISASHTMCLTNVGEIVTLSADDVQAAVDKHNQFRGDVTPNASDMQKVVWDDGMAQVAAKWAAQCEMAHDDYLDRSMPDMPGVMIGQNVAAGGHDLVGAIQMWANEESAFSYGQNPTGVVGHYTQIVLSTAGRIGCGVANCPGSPYGKFQVCNYARGQSSSAYKTPFTNGASSCSECTDHCDSTGKLCDCGGKVCNNGGTLDVGTCTCTCSALYTGDLCDTVNCQPDASNCPLYTQYFGNDVCSKYTNVPAECPKMCGVC